MLRKICPICEQAMKLSHYCKNCRRFVKTPYVRDVTYYLNERHPEKEKNCEYHSTYGEENRPAPYVRPAPPMPVDSRPEGRKRAAGGAGGRTAVLAVVGAMVLVQIIGAAKVFTDKISSCGSFEDDTETEEFWSLTDEEVQSAGVACNSYGHYSIDGIRMAEEIERIIRGSRYNIDDMTTFSFNYETEDEDGLWANYRTMILYDISLTEKDQENVDSESITVDYDTATGQLHRVVFYMAEPESAALLSEEILDFLQEQGELPEKEDYGSLMAGQIAEYSDRGEYEDTDMVQRKILKDGEWHTEYHFYEMDGRLCVTISRMQ